MCVPLCCSVCSSMFHWFQCVSLCVPVCVSLVSPCVPLVPVCVPVCSSVPHGASLLSLPVRARCSAPRESAHRGGELAGAQEAAGARAHPRAPAKVVLSLLTLAYAARLDKANLCSLELRRLHADLCICYKIIN